MLRDEFFWLNQISRATVVVGLRNGQFSADIARAAARGISDVEKQGESDPKARVKMYIAWEPLLIKAAGAEVTVIHAGRSSQDILSTQRTAMLRDRTFEFARGMDGVIGDLLALAQTHRGTIVPSYTNGVAAQPTSYAHYLLGIAASLLRVRKRLDECLERFDACAMGSTVLNGTCWPLDRRGMAEALGFSRILMNAFDATSLSPVDMPLEVASCAAAAAVRIGSMLNDIMVQYAQPRPWILLKEGGENTYVSSAMPQKRNPGLINNCREECSDVIGEMETCFARAHNVVSGMRDGKTVTKNARMMAAACAMTTRFRKVLAALVVNPARALEELNLDWTASQEIADRLMADHGLPFRIGHHVSSEVVGFARANGILPLEFPYSEIERIYRAVIEKEFPEGPAKLPMSEAEFRDALDPRKIVENRRTEGSASPAEVEKMITAETAELARLSESLSTRAAQVETSLEKLALAFETLL